MTIVPALFIGHGSPMNILEDNSYTRFLETYDIGKPAAIVVVSAHWVTRGSRITAASLPPQIYDFYGFPEELYRFDYQMPGAPDLAKRISVASAGKIVPDESRGIDHAAWAVLCRMFPKDKVSGIGISIPVLEISLDAEMSFREHYALAGILAQFRKEGVLFIGSGNMIHNLGELSYAEDDTPYDWAAELDAWFGDRLEARDHDALLEASSLAPQFHRGAPTTEHFIPLLYTLGMCLPGERIRTIHASMHYASLSMRAIEIS